MRQLVDAVYLGRGDVVLYRRLSERLEMRWWMRRSYDASAHSQTRRGET